MIAPRCMVSAAHKSSGKTTVTLGLAAAFAARGMAVQTFKKGPDYIDPIWLAAASHRPCFNLDPYLSDDGALRERFARSARDADLSLVEGNKGLYDGVALDGSNSNAALARLLSLPVVLVLDARGVTRGVAPLILGYQAFDKDICIAGVIFNRVGGSRHEAKLRAVVERYTDVPVLGAIAQDERLNMTERHLGLVPASELADAQVRVQAVVAAVQAQVDLDRLLAIAQAAPALDAAQRLTPVAGAPLRVGVVRDRAFGFYYPDDLEALRDHGATLLPIDALQDRTLPGMDALFIGGGFPEMHMDALAANVGLREQLRAAVEAGLPVYAECGGLMYLSRSLHWRGKTAPMVGALPADVVMHERPVGRGYVHLQETADFPWPAVPGEQAPAEVRAHEFHHSSLENVDAGVRFSYRVLRGHGVDGARDGVVWRNVLGSYAHRRGTGDDHWVPRFLAFARERAATRSTASAQPALESAGIGSS